MIKEKFNKPYKGKKKIKKNVDKNRIYAFILLGLFVFWTIASVLGISAFARQRKDDKVVSASAEESTLDFNYTDFAYNLFDRDTPYLLPLNGGPSRTFDCSFNYDERGVPYIDINFASSDVSGNQPGILFSFSSLSNYLNNNAIGANCTFMFQIDVNYGQVDTSQYYSSSTLNSNFLMWYNYDDGVTANSFKQRMVNGEPFIYTSFTWYGDDGTTDYTNRVFAVLYKGFTYLRLKNVQLYVSANDTSFKTEAPSIKYYKTYDEGFNDGLKQNLQAYSEGIFMGANVIVDLPAVDSYSAIHANIPISRLINKSTDFRQNGLSLSRIITVLDDLGYEGVRLRPASIINIEIVFNKQLYPSYFLLDIYAYFEYFDAPEIKFTISLRDSNLVFDLPIIRDLEVANPPYHYYTDIESLYNIEGLYVNSLNISIPSPILVAYTPYIIDSSTLFRSGLDQGFKNGYDAALRAFDTELNAEYKKGYSEGKKVGKNEGYTELC